MVTLALLSPPDDSLRTPGTERSASAALAALPCFSCSAPSVEIDTLAASLDVRCEVPVTMIWSRFSVAGLSAALGVAAVAAPAAGSAAAGAVAGASAGLASAVDAAAGADAGAGAGAADWAQAGVAPHIISSAASATGRRGTGT
jgi:hypothetical protein